METKKVKKKRFNVARTLVFILLIYIVVCFGIYLYKEPVKHYEIIGNEILTDIELIRDLKLEKYPSFVSINTKKLEHKLESNKLIKNAKVSYGWNFKLKIEIEENSPMFLAKDLNKVVLADGTFIDFESRFIGIPTLLNSTPEVIMTELASSLNKVDYGIRYIISEIEYQPSYSSDGKIIDENRFLLSMSDRNLVYITAKKADSLNEYLDIIATEQITKAGTLFLDSNEGRYTFKFHEETTEEVVVDEE